MRMPSRLDFSVLPRKKFAWFTPSIGTEETINGVNQADFKDYYGKWYAASNATVIVVADAEPAVKRAAHLDHPPRRAHGTGGHAGGASVRGCAMNRPGRSLLAVDGGLPPIFAGASAHHGRSVPSVSRTAIRPCDGSSSV